MSHAEHDELHEALREAADATTPHPIDVDAVLRASRARRRARRTAAAGGVGAAVALLAVGGLVFGMQQGTGPVSGQAPIAVQPTEGEDAAAPDGAAGTPESATGFLTTPADALPCGEPATRADAATSPLVVAVTPPGSVPPGGSAAVAVTVTNDGAAPVEGELWSTPVVAIFDDGAAVSRSIPAGDAVLAISLEPGESITVTGSFETVGCIADAATPDSAAAAVPLPAGAYELGVVVGFLPDRGEPVLLDSPLVPLTIR